MKSYKIIDSMQHEIIEVLMQAPHNKLLSPIDLRTSLNADIADENFKQAIANLVIGGYVNEYQGGYKVSI